MTYECFEICQHDDGHEIVKGCGSTHKKPEAAVKHGKSHFYPYLSSNQPVTQLRLEVRDASGKVVRTLTHRSKLGRSSYARWVASEGSA